MPNRFVLAALRALVLLAALAGPALALAPTARAADDAGYVREWLACGPWPEKDADRQLMDADELAFEGHVTVGRLWTRLDAREDGFVDLSLLGAAGQVASLAHVYVFSDRDRELLLLLGADDRVDVYLNGILSYKSPRTATWQADQHRTRLRLIKGWNRLMVRGENEAAGFGFSLRFVLPDGRPTQLKSSATGPEELLEQPQLVRPLSKEEVDELLEILAGRINSAAGQTRRALAAWQADGACLDPGYAAARQSATTYVQAIQDVLETISGGKAPAADRARLAEAARLRLRQEAQRGPQLLAARTEEFIAYAEKGSRLWQMVRFAAGTAIQAGNQAGAVDRALVEARGLLAGVESEYLRPARLRELTLRHRTMATRLRLLAADGTPLKEAEVSVEQLRHEFLFGGNLFAFGLFATAPLNQQYQDRFAALFNLAVVPFYWSLTEPREGHSDYARDAHGRPGPEAMIDWCQANQIAVRGSPLLSNESQPPWLRLKSAEAAAPLVEAHVRELVGRFKGRVESWDVCPGAWETLGFGKLQLQAIYPFKWAAETDPSATLLASHYGTHPLMLAAELNKRQPFNLGGLALTAYQADGPITHEELEARLARLRSYNLPVHLDQVMIPGPPRGEKRQAEAVESFYRSAFANPLVRSITWWDLSDRFSHRGQPGGLLRSDLAPKPAYETLQRLIRQEWWTTVEGRCDELGNFAFRGFYGRYRVRAWTTDTPRRELGQWDLDLTRTTPPELVLTSEQ